MSGILYQRRASSERLNILPTDLISLKLNHIHPRELGKNQHASARFFGSWILCGATIWYCRSRDSAIQITLRYYCTNSARLYIPVAVLTIAPYYPSTAQPERNMLSTQAISWRINREPREECKQKQTSLYKYSKNGLYLMKKKVSLIYLKSLNCSLQWLILFVTFRIIEAEINKKKMIGLYSHYSH